MTASIETFAEPSSFCLMDKLQYQTPLSWAQNAVLDMPQFMQDHASCERKASATCLSFVVKFPDRSRLVESMISMAREELEHFHQVYQQLQKRGIPLSSDEKDLYVNQLMLHLRKESDERFLDRLLLAGIIEARGCERFALVAQTVPDAELQTFYYKLAKAERRHNQIFVEHALDLFPGKKVLSRLSELLHHEAKIVENLPWRHLLH